MCMCIQWVLQKVNGKIELKGKFIFVQCFWKAVCSFFHDTHSSKIWNTLVCVCARTNVYILVCVYK